MIVIGLSYVGVEVLSVCTVSAAIHAHAHCDLTEMQLQV